MTSTTVVAHRGALDARCARTHHVAPHAPAEHARLTVRLLVGLAASAEAGSLECSVQILRKNLGWN